MADDFVEQGGLLLPRHMAQSTVKTKNPIPLALLQVVVNSLFYKMEEAPLNFIGTLGREDPLLPRAKAADFAGERYSDTMHEIGPGNFHFARTFVDSARGIDGLVYNCHDISDATFRQMGEKLVPYGRTINFHRTSLREFPDKVGDDPLEAVLVEVLDDILTEFFTMNQGNTYVMAVCPEMDAGLKFPSRALAGKLRVLDGDFSQATHSLAANGLEREYSAADIISMMDMGQWQELEKLYLAFLTHVRYQDKQFFPMDVSEYVYRHHWKDMPDSFREYGDAVLAFYRKQLEFTEHAGTREPLVASLPLAGLTFLWRLKDRKKAHIDFFDYGYDSMERKIIEFSTHTGQITAPVNFEIMRHAAEVLGFNTVLEQDRDYIKRHLGEDTIRLTYAARAFRKAFGSRAADVMYDMFRDSVEELCPGVSCTRDNIMGFRVRRANYEAFLSVAKEQGIVAKDFETSEGSYHLAVYK